VRATVASRRKEGRAADVGVDMRRAEGVLHQKHQSVGGRSAVLVRGALRWDKFRLTDLTAP
jgi:hypothetical protein